MKKLLFILFFPITIPLYLIYRFFGWLSDTFIPFVQYDVIPFLSDTLFPAIKKFINYIKEKSAERKEIKEKAESTTAYSAETQIINTPAENYSDIQLKCNSIEMTAESDFYSLSDTELVQNNNDKENIFQSSKTKSSIEDSTYHYKLSTSIYPNDWYISAVGHLPPFTDEEYRKIRHSETLSQIDRLKKYHDLNSFESCYGSAKVYEIWGAKYRLLAIKCFEKSLEFTPTVPITNIYFALADLYEKSHQFEKAVNILQKAIKNTPGHSGGSTQTAICLVKLGKIDEAIEILKAVKKNDYYKNPNPSIDPSFTTCIDRRLEDCLNKKERGYKFKPRKDAFDYIDPNNFSLNKICNEYLQKWS